MFPIDFEKLIIKMYDALRTRLTPTPIPLASDLYLGQTERLYHRGIDQKLFLTPATRAKHIYILGGTGSGKTTVMNHMIREDTSRGNGFALLEPHADLCNSVVSFIASLWVKKEQHEKETIAKKTILIEPFNSQAIVPFNPLEVSENNPNVYPLILDMVAVLKARWGDCIGPRNGELLRNALYALCHGMTLLECPALLINTGFRNSLLDAVKNDEIKDYFIYRYNKLREADKVKYREPVLNKILELITEKGMRYTLGAKNGLDLQKVMDQGGILILNFSKAHLRSNALLLGGLFLSKLQIAGLSRIYLPFENRRPFTIYIDEFQNFINEEEGGDVETFLSESRKARINLVIAHQSIAQLNSKLLGSILSNVNVIISFRLSRKDAMTIAPEIDPQSKDELIEKLVGLKVGEAFVKVKTEPTRLVQLPYPEVPQVDEAIVEEFKRHCASFHARSAEEIEEEIQERHQRWGLKHNIKQNGKSETHKTEVEEKNEEASEEEGQNGW